MKNHCLKKFNLLFAFLAVAFLCGGCAAPKAGDVRTAQTSVSSAPAADSIGADVAYVEFRDAFLEKLRSAGYEISALAGHQDMERFKAERGGDAFWLYLLRAGDLGNYETAQEGFSPSGMVIFIPDGDGSWQLPLYTSADGNYHLAVLTGGPEEDEMEIADIFQESFFAEI